MRGERWRRGRARGGEKGGVGREEDGVRWRGKGGCKGRREGIE